MVVLALLSLRHHFILSQKRKDRLRSDIPGKVFQRQAVKGAAVEIAPKVNPRDDFSALCHQVV